MIHTPYTICVQQPRTFRIIPQQVQHCSSLLRHLINAQTSRYWLEVHNPGGFIFFMLCSLVDWLIHFSPPIVSLFSDRSCTIYFSDPVHFNIKPLNPSTLRLGKPCGFETTKINGEWQLINTHYISTLQYALMTNGWTWMIFTLGFLNLLEVLGIWFLLDSW